MCQEVNCFYRFTIEWLTEIISHCYSDKNHLLLYNFKIAGANVKQNDIALMTNRENGFRKKETDYGMTNDSTNALITMMNTGLATKTHKITRKNCMLFSCLYYSWISGKKKAAHFWTAFVLRCNYFYSTTTIPFAITLTAFSGLVIASISSLDFFASSA